MNRSSTLVALVLLVALSACASKTRSIAVGMVTGASVGAAVGHQFVHHGRYRQYETRNTIVTSVVFALAVGGAMLWHYRELEQQQVEISGRYARLRLCDPEELKLTERLTVGEEPQGAVQSLEPSQLGKLAISLDDQTKWSLPIFRKRFLNPERGETQLLSERYIWEIIKPGSFVTRSQNPDFFFEGGPDAK